ncbi:Tom37 C-terminal domain containing protein [Naviculisporaceae sp. PSN 640]
MLELHVWGPAFGLPSIDAECLATIAYFTQTLDETEYHLIQSSPSAVPTHHLPALHDPSQKSWTSGYSAITSHLRSTHPFNTPEPSKKAQADSTAYNTFLTSNAPPLISLSLYVSSANWSTTTRPSYSKILPFPLPWTEPPAIRAAMSARASHLGLSSLDTDAEEEKAEAAAKADPGWVHIPDSIKKNITQRRKAVRESLSPEARSRIRLEGLTAEVLDVVGEVLSGDEEADGETTLELRCLAFGYLALMLVPEVPRPWLSEVMRGKYPGLCEFVEDFGGRTCRLLPGKENEARQLPWAKHTKSKDEETEVRIMSTGSRNSHTLSGVLARFAHGLVRDIPLVGEEWARWWAQQRAGDVMKTSSSSSSTLVSRRNKDLVLVASSGISLVGVAAGLFYLYKGLLPLGAPIQTWRTPVSVGLSGLGAAGALFSGLDLS